jgi:hypothetical protein
MGIKITQNKKLLVKDYQSNTKKGNIVVHDQYTITEISTFTKHETPSGDITYKAESGHDDSIMSCIVLSTVFGMVDYKDAVDNLIESLDSDTIDTVKEYSKQYQDNIADINTMTSGYKKIYNNSRSPINSNSPFDIQKSFDGKSTGLFARPGLPNRQLSFPNKDRQR